jgi:very-short-patch-repair endonuclease
MATNAMENKPPHKPRSSSQPSKRGEALVCVMNNVRDWKIAHDDLWYRIPAEKAPKRWPPEWIAFYQTKIFGDEAFTVTWYGRVKWIDRLRRRDLFPDEGQHAKSNREYFQVHLESLQRLPKPIPSRRLRLIVFIPTTLHKLTTAEEINDLFDDSPLEDALWSEMKRLEMRAERQYYLKHDGDWFALDFALFCQKGNLDVETDGDRWHSALERIPEDNRRNNALAALGYQVLRFNTAQVREEMVEYCVPQLVETVNRLGGVVTPREAGRSYYKTEDGVVWQLRMFDGGESDRDE